MCFFVTGYGKYRVKFFESAKSLSLAGLKEDPENLKSFEGL